MVPPRSSVRLSEQYNHRRNPCQRLFVVARYIFWVKAACHQLRISSFQGNLGNPLTGASSALFTDPQLSPVTALAQLPNTAAVGLTVFVDQGAAAQCRS